MTELEIIQRRKDIILEMQSLNRKLLENEDPKTQSKILDQLKILGKELSDLKKVKNG